LLQFYWHFEADNFIAASEVSGTHLHVHGLFHEDVFSQLKPESLRSAQLHCEKFETRQKFKPAAGK
jgi:hypothetical protein